MKIARPLAKLIESFQKMPGIGPKTAQRLAYYSLHIPQTELDAFAEALSNLKKDTVLCSICRNVSEANPCSICEDSRRDKTRIMVVEQPLDVLVFERTGKFNGVYHVLHGAISPLENIGPDELYIEDLFKRIKNNADSVSLETGKVEEIIIATNPTMEGDATAMYLAKKINEQFLNGKSIIVTRLGMGIPTGADLEYADDTTLNQALEGRRVM